MNTLIGRWQSVGGRWVAELWKGETSGFYYRGSGCSGYLGNDITEAQAVAEMEKRCAAGVGYFQPDTNVTPMVRVARFEAQS